MRIDRIKLIAEMARQDVTVNELAKVSGVSRVTITAIRTGKTCTPTTCAKLAAALGVDPAELVEKE